MSQVNRRREKQWSNSIVFAKNLMGIVNNFKNREEAIMQDIFITNMLADDIQRKLLSDTVEPERAISIAINMEMGHQNQQRISPTTVK